MFPLCQGHTVQRSSTCQLLAAVCPHYVGFPIYTVLFTMAVALFKGIIIDILPVDHRLLQEYDVRRAEEGDLSDADLPPEMAAEEADVDRAAFAAFSAATAHAQSQVLTHARLPRQLPDGPLHSPQLHVYRWSISPLQNKSLWPIFIPHTRHLGASA